ncbi:MAG: gliding motility-associated C-terminal domain-containing protein [Saprospiraceae bacterium]|nr:gliding motility-associated C-terminal domain-containing protein [Saprospiraceae bacterium]HMW40293.1 gliding motility-associated C-terminal domain-containing protein [Saprospiraceae bacterium]HMX89228.1 gliding motility-associated C-terminal domain-containing protein [Saprospiraceae bacterium]HMZ40287.1 gliding motility-associated C-terminal domain-containing protein [Saprospiraceae bacterium]HNA65135.1 gliding motility-associated C-terminal domain-containing protein [Saprospiraceae bacteri
MKNIKFWSFWLLSLAIWSPGDAQCNFTVNAGPDIKVCNAGDMKMMAGKITGQIREAYWEPTTGLADPKNPTTKVTINGNMEYILTAKGTSGINLVINGDFEQGKTGFSTDYIVGFMSCYGAGYLDCEGTYDVITNPQIGHSGFAPCKDHTSGGGNMMVLNGAAAFQNVWCESVPVMPDMDYIFTCWVTAVVSASPPILQFNINGNSIGPVFNSSGSTCLWEKYEVIWNSGSNTLADICILNQNTASGGNDFAIDDISFVKICEKKDTMMVSVEEINIDIEDPGEVNCDRPQLKINAKGSSQGKNWTYKWTTSNGKIISGDNTLEPTIEGPGTYELTICSDLPGCCKKAFIEITGNIKPPDLTVTVLDSIGCINDSVIIYTNSSVNPLNYFWEGPDGYISNEMNTIVYKGGTYTVTVVDEYNCKTVKSVKVVESGDLPKISISGNQINCQSDSARLRATSSVKGSGFNWTGPKGFKSSSDSIVTADSGVYYLRVVTPQGCVRTDSFRVFSDRSAPTLRYTSDSINCLRDSALINIITSRNLVNAEWKSFNQFKNIDSLHIVTRVPGQYIFLATADNFCTDSLLITIPADTVHPVFTPKEDTITCAHPDAILSSGFKGQFKTLEWEGPNGTIGQQDNITTQTGGKYIIRITSSNDCTTEKAIQISVDTLHPSLNLNSDTLTCIRDSLMLSLNDLYKSSYQWSGPGGYSSTLQNPTIRVPGIYTVDASLQNGCRSSIQTLIAEDKQLPQISYFNDTLNCLKDSTILRATADQPSARFEWRGPNQFVSTLKAPFIKNAGRYILTVTNPNGCRDSVALNITLDARKPDLSVNADTINCIRTTAQLLAHSVRDSLSYLWSGPNNFSSTDSVIQTTQAGFYKIRITAPDFCYTEVTVQVAIDTAAPRLQSYDDTINCLQTQLILTPLSTGNMITNYQWSGPGNFNSNGSNPLINIPGMYVLVARSANGCRDSASLNVAIDTAAPSITLSSDTITCSRPNVDIIATVTPPGLTGQWVKPDNQIVNQNLFRTSDAGRYRFEVTAKNHCQNKADLIIAIDTIKPDIAVRGGTINCRDRQILIEGMSKSQGARYAWNGPAGFASNAMNSIVSIPGDYALTITASNGCTNNTLLKVGIDTITPALTLSADSIGCTRPLATVQAKTNIAGGTITWRNAVLDSIGNTAQWRTAQGGRYYAEVTDPVNFCKTVREINVIADSLIITDIQIAPHSPLCGQTFGSASISRISGGHPQILYSLDGGNSFVNETNFSSLKPGHYQLLARDQQGCTFLKDFEILDIPPIMTSLPPEIDLKLGENGLLDLDILSNPLLIRTIQWRPTDFLSCSDCEDPKTTTPADINYEVVVTDTNQCQSIQRIRVKVIDPEVWVPNVFSPNGDGVNDWVYVFGSGEKVTNVRLFEIFDRWGNKVFSKENVRPNVPDSGWNGQYHSETCVTGVYTYWAEVELINGKHWIIKGDVTLIR